jgi:hypothetical protein
MSRKYKQRGYMDYEHETRDRPRSRDRSHFKQEPLRITIRVFKCSRCGHVLHDPSTIAYESVCTKCKSDLRTCVNCSFFDPSSRFQCLKEIKANISPKDKRNRCKIFNPKASVETKLANVESQQSARKAFEDLFKKG